MRSWVKYGVFLLIIFAMVLWLGGFLAKKEKAGEIKRESPHVQGLTVGQVEKAIEVVSYYAGQVVADKRVEVSTRLMGKIKGVFVEEGQSVKLGQTLVSIDAEDIKAQASALDHQVAQAEQALRSAMAQHDAVKKTFERYSALLKEGAITQQEFDQVKAQFESAKAQVEQARAGIKAVQSQKQAVVSNLKYSSITSPISGYVVQKNVDAGDLAVPGHTLLVIESPPYLFEVFLPERFAGKVKVGQEYSVQIPSLGENLTGRVVEVSPSLDVATRTFRVKLQLQQKESLRSGMYGSLLLPEKVEVLLVPESAIVRRFDFTGVWVVKPDNTLELRFVKLGEKRGDKVEVLSGLKEGERIVIQGVEKACEGCRVGG
ncbi:MAG: efflux RND transporter periplasmic adaptor subunit [Aquificaceae bacterium]|nr:efflux RND transporter periplasmic adaptor subunit [Aquificaceae bacterium]MDW8422988.1 efflux RND transporter periplasmic adaptor subunit [Aquificaceae bacterium]